MNGDRKCKIYADLKCDLEWQDENKLPEKGKKQWICDLYQGWPEEVKECIMAADEETIVPRRIYGFKHGLKWDSQVSGVTILGEAPSSWKSWIN